MCNVCAVYSTACPYADRALGREGLFGIHRGEAKPVANIAHRPCDDHGSGEEVQGLEAAAMKHLHICCATRAARSCHHCERAVLNTFAPAAAQTLLGAAPS